MFKESNRAERCRKRNASRLQDGVGGTSGDPIVVDSSDTEEVLCTSIKCTQSGDDRGNARQSSEKRRVQTGDEDEKEEEAAASEDNNWSGSESSDDDDDDDMSDEEEEEEDDAYQKNIWMEQVDVFQELLRNKNPENEYVSPYWYSKLAGQGNSWPIQMTKKMIFIPICKSGHWRLVVGDVGTKTLRHYDSLNNCTGEMFLKHIRKFLADSLNEDVDDWSFGGWRRSPPKQKNGTDCGVFVCMAMLFGSPLAIDVRNISLYRYLLRRDINKKNLGTNDEYSGLRASKVRQRKKTFARK